MSKDIKKALEHCVEWNCVDCPNKEELGSGETVCRGRLLPEVLDYVSDLEAKLAELEKALELACYKLTDFESKKKESMHSSQYWYDYLKQRAKEQCNE